MHRIDILCESNNEPPQFIRFEAETINWRLIRQAISEQILGNTAFIGPVVELKITVTESQI